MTKNKNEVLKKTLLHYINLEYYANGIDDEFQTLLSELEERCAKAISSQTTLNTKLSYTVVMRLIKEEVEKYQKELEERLDEEAERIMNQELDFIDNTYNKPIEQGKASGTMLALGGIAVSKLLFAPIAGNETVHQFAEKIGKNILRSYDTSLRAGYLFGQKTEDLNNQISTKMKTVAKGMKNGIRTAIPSFAKTTDRIIFLNNNVEVVWVATLDGRTCINCAGLSGMHFKSITEAPSVPLHWLCRCSLQVASTITEPIPDFEEFIESLDEEDQIHVLGRNRFDLWKQYGTSLRQFINNGTVLSPEEALTEDVANKVANEKTAKLVKKYYPNDTFVSKKITDTSRLYVSKARIKAGVKDPEVYNSDKLMAKFLSKETGLDFYMLTEKSGKGVKKPDGFYISATMEMKHIRGGIEKLGKRAIEALDQSGNVFIYCDNSFSEEACIRKIRGSVVAKRGDTKKVFIEPNKDSLLYIYTNGTLYKHTWGDVL